MENEQNIIDICNLTKDYGSGRGVFDVSIYVRKGEVFGFLGPNGAGKSTTIRHLMGFSKPDSGSTKIFGKETFNNYYQILSNVGYIPGEIALPAGLTGEEFIRMMQSLQGVKNDAMLKEMLDLFQLDEVSLKTDTKRMSLGVKRKLAVVTAFMNDPDVLILDEPTSGLDPLMQEVFVNLIHKKKAEGKTILLSSHIFSEIDSTCDRIAIIKDGKIVSSFIADELKHASLKKYTIELEETDKIDTFLKESSKINSLKIDNTDYKQGIINLSLEDEDLNAFLQILKKYNVTKFSNKRESLEEYFMKFYKEYKDFKEAIK